MSIKIVDVETQYKLNPDLKKEDVAMLAEWVRRQPHLPQITELELILFLHSCYYSNEAAKKCIDNFYTVRLHAPEFFRDKNPNSLELKTTLEKQCIMILPKLTPENYAVFYARAIDPNPDFYVFNHHVRLMDMMATLALRQLGCVKGVVMILDFYGGTFTHMTKISLSSLKKSMFFVQEAFPVRLKGLHFINPVNFMDKVMAFIKPFLNKELQTVMHVHKDDGLFKHIPKECVPNESGGTLGPLSELYAAALKTLQSNADFLIEDGKKMTDESKRPGKPRDAGEVFGMEGTFKKLDID